MRLTDFAFAAESDCRDINRRIDELPALAALVFDDCELPPGCAPGAVAVNFYKDAAFYALCLSPPVCYAGQNPAMSALSDGKSALFADFDGMRRFFRELPLETAPLPACLSDAPPEACDPARALNAGEIIPPTESARPVPDYKDIRRELAKSVIGQETAIEAIAHQVALHLGKSNPKRPLSIVAYGPPGTGKSETAKLLAKTLSKLGPHRYADVWTDLNQFAEAHSVFRLIGSPPGYVGYNDRPIFDAVTDNPRTVFIFDELDKAHIEVLKTFMAVLDEGRCAAAKEQADHSREYDFKRCIFVFTSNHRLGTTPQNRGGLSVSESVEDIRFGGGAIEVDYAENHSEDNPKEEPAELTKRVYRNTETARKAFVGAGVLTEIASRFNCFAEFKELSAEAKARILAKQVIETGFEYGIRLTHIAAPVLRALIDASSSEDAMTVRSFKAVIEGYLAAAFAGAGAKHGNRALRLEGTIETPRLVPAYTGEH